MSLVWCNVNQWNMVHHHIEHTFALCYFNDIICWYQKVIAIDVIYMDFTIATSHEWLMLSVGGKCKCVSRGSPDGYQYVEKHQGGVGSVCFWRLNGTERAEWGQVVAAFRGRVCSKDNFNLNIQPYLELLDEPTPAASQKDIQDVGFFSIIITNFVLFNVLYSSHGARGQVSAEKVTENWTVFHVSDVGIKQRRDHLWGIKL